MFLYLLLFLVLLIFVHYKVKFGYWKRRGLSGPTPWPFFGNVLTENFLADSEELEKNYLAKYGPVFGTYAGSKPVFNTSVPEHIKQVLMNPDDFNQTEVFEIGDDYIRHSLFFKNGGPWKSDRTAMSHHFTSAKLRSLIGHFKGITDNFLNNIDELNQQNGNEKINVKPLLKCYGIDCISRFIFAIDCNSWKDESEWVKLAKRFGDSSAVAFILQFFLPKWLTRLLKIDFFDLEPINGLGAMFSRVLKERRSTDVRYNDLSETIQQAIDNGLEMDERTKLGNCLLGFLAGVDTVTSALCKVFEYLVIYPDIQERLYQELKSEFSAGITYEALTQHAYLDAFLNETLRLGTQVLVMVKRAAKDTKIGEFEIEKGVEIALIPYLSHRSPDHYVEPEKFDPERFLDKSPNNPNKFDAGAFLPFSQGKRNCIGKLLATLEMKYIIVTTLLKFELKKPKDFKVEADDFRGGRAIKNLPILFGKRQ